MSLLHAHPPSWCQYICIPLHVSPHSRRIDLAQRAADLKLDNGTALIKSSMTTWLDGIRAEAERDVQVAYICALLECGMR